MNSNDFQIISQLVATMNDAISNLERAYKQRDMDQFRQSQEEIIKIQKKIDRHDRNRADRQRQRDVATRLADFFGDI